MPATVIQVISLLPIITHLLFSLASSVTSTTVINPKPSQLLSHQQPPPAPAPPLYNSVEELWELCQSFPAMEHCDVFTSGGGGVSPMTAMVNNDNGMVEKRKSAYMRFGRSDPSSSLFYADGLTDPMGQVEKRKSAYMRFGKRSSSPSQAIDADAPEMMMAGEAEKRKSAYMRFGKRKSAYMRFGKRSAGPSSDDDVATAVMEKRKSAYMRFGK